MSVTVLHPLTLLEEFDTPLNGNDCGKLYGQIYIARRTGKPVLRCCVCHAEYRFYIKFLDHLYEHRNVSKQTEQCLEHEESKEKQTPSVRMSDIQLPEEPIYVDELRLKDCPFLERADELDQLLNLKSSWAEADDFFEQILTECETAESEHSISSEEDDQKETASSDSEDRSSNEQALSLPPQRKNKKTKKSMLPPRQRFSCDKCKRAYAKITTLDKHRSQRYCTRNFTCDICNKKFNNNSSLMAHKRKHTGERPFVCKCCGKIFSRAKALVRHERSNENRCLNVRPLKCIYCEKDYFHQSKLASHMNTHTLKRIFECTVCGKTFLNGKHLALHTKIHDNARSYVCGMCGKSFNQPAARYLHMKLSHNVVRGQRIERDD